MYSLWNSFLLWVLLCLLSSTVTEDSPSIVLSQTEATSEEGSCVTINCKYMHQREIQLLWFKDPIWNITGKRFDGLIVYSNTKTRPQVSEYSDRVEFFNEQNEENRWTTCTLKIKDLKKNDNGLYAFRYIFGEKKYMSKEFHLKVTDNPCNPYIDRPNLNNSLTEGDRVSLYCETSANCQTHPKWQSSGSGEVLSTENRDDLVKKRSELKLTLSWTDHERTLTCSSESNNECLIRRITLRVEYAPKETKVIENLSNGEVKEGEQVTILCSSKAHPKANFTWFKHQSSFSQPGENLTLYNITSEKEGRFYCQAENEHGRENSSDINIKVVYAPKGVNISPVYNYLREGDRLTLTCSVQKSNPEVGEQSYRWYKDGQVINHQTSSTITVQSLTRGDKGSYECQAINSIGETMSSHHAQLSVKYVPQNTNIPFSSSGIKLGYSLSLVCDTEADPPPNKYYWYFKPESKQQFLTLSQTNNEYRVWNVAASNAGMYKCSAQNDLGRGANSTERSVLVFYPPTNLNLTMKQVVEENELHTITCTVKSSPQAKLTLSMSSLKNPEERAIKFVQQSNFLNFTSTALVSHAGKYSCLAENTEGYSVSETHLEVLYAPKNVKASAHPGEELKEGSNLVLNCIADSVPPVSAYTWKKSDSSGKHSVTVGNGQTITLHFLKSSDFYSCIASNKIGSTWSSEIYIRVKYRPRITIIHNLTSLGLMENEIPVHLSCSAQSDPPATSFAWYKLEENTTLLSDEQNYTVQPQNPGTYYCYARNEIGETRSEPVKIYLNHLIIKWLLQIVIVILIITFLIGVILLLQRRFLRKLASGENESFFFSAGPLRSLSNLRSSDLQNNTRENLVMAGSTDLSGYREESSYLSGYHSVTDVYSNPPANRNAQVRRPNSNIHTVYDAIKLPPSMSKHNHTEEDLTMTTVNYGMQLMDSSNQNKSGPSRVICGPVYAEVSKNKQKPKEQRGGQEDYENISSMCAPTQPFPNIYWDSDSSESDDEVKYTKVLFTVASHHNPQKDTFVSNEEEKTEYAEVKV